MLIYNVTTKITHAIHEDWLQWMRDIHIPDVLATGCFTKANILRLLDIDDSEGPTYAIQYYAETKADYDKYIQQFAPALKQETINKWDQQIIAFRSLMQLVN
jgi:hypothetical protein